jgi:hypothetical protein
MRKEIIFAILAGAIFGLVIAFGIWKANSSMKSKNGNEKEIVDVTDIKDGTTMTSDFSITLIKPESNTVVSTSSTLVSGITKPDVWLVISAEEDDYIIKTGNDGAFEEEVKLIAGANEIVVTAIEESTNESVYDKFLVVYSTELEKSSNEDTEEESE